MSKSSRALLIFILLIIAPRAFAFDRDPRVVVTTTDQESDDPRWNDTACLNTFRSLQAAIPVSSTCFAVASRDMGVVLDPRVREIRRAAAADLYIHVQRVDQKETRVRVVNFREAEDELDFRDVTLRFRKGDYMNMVSVQRLTANLSHYLAKKNMFKTQMVVDGIRSSKILEVRGDGAVVDNRTGSEISLREAYEIYKNESPTTRAYLRGSLELAATLGFALYQYHQIESNRLDHDLHGGYWDRLKLKIRGHANGTDDNATSANIGHIGAGVVYYQIFRSNGLGPLESTLFTYASSAAWEYLFEHKEIMSENDMLMTGIAGAAVGEVFHKMSLAIRNKSNSPVAKVLAAILNPVGSLNHQLNKWEGTPKIYPREGGLDSRLFANFELGFGWARVDRGGESVEALKLRGAGEVYEIDLFHEPGKARKLLLTAPVSKMELEFSASKVGTEDFRLLARQVLLAYYQKDMKRDEAGHLRGYEVIIGGGSALDWEQSRSAPIAFEDSKDPLKDMVVSAHIAEGTVEAFGYYKGFRFRMALEISGDFAMVRNLALEEYVTANGPDGLLSVLQKRGYYYGTGWSRAVQASIEHGRWTLSGKLKHTTLDQSKWRHRHQENVTFAGEISDEQAKAEIGLVYKFNKTTSARVYCLVKERESTFGVYSKAVKTKECGTQLLLLY